MPLLTSLQTLPILQKKRSAFPTETPPLFRSPAPPPVCKNGSKLCPSAISSKQGCRAFPCRRQPPLVDPPLGGTTTKQGQGQYSAGRRAYILTGLASSSHWSWSASATTADRSPPRSTPPATGKPVASGAECRKNVTEITPFLGVPERQFCSGGTRNGLVPGWVGAPRKEPLKKLATNPKFFRDSHRNPYQGLWPRTSQGG